VAGLAFGPQKQHRPDFVQSNSTGDPAEGFSERLGGPGGLAAASVPPTSTAEGATKTGKRHHFFLIESEKGDGG